MNRSIRQTIISRFSLLLLLSFLVALPFVLLGAYKFSASTLDRNLDFAAELLLIVAETDPDSNEHTFWDESDIGIAEEVVFQVFRGGIPILLSEDAPRDPIVLLSGYKQAFVNGISSRVLRKEKGDVAVIVSEPESRRLGALIPAAGLLLSFFFFAWVVLLVFSRREARLVADSVEKDVAAAVSGPSSSGFVELAPMRDKLFSLVEEIRRVSLREREFLALFSHELRTPLAVSRLRAEHLMDEPLLAALERVDDISRQFLLLSKGERMDGYIFPVRDAVAAAVEDVLSVYPQLDVSCEDMDGFVIDGVPLLLRQAIGNLLLNVGQKGASRVLVEVLDGEIRVIDEPGRQVSQGHGIGLAVVERVATLFGGSFELSLDENGAALARLNIPSIRRTLSS